MMITISHELYDLEINPGGSALWLYRPKPLGSAHPIQAPVFEIDGQVTPAQVTALVETRPAKNLLNGCREYAFTGNLVALPGVALQLVLRTAPGNPIVRFQYILTSQQPHQLTKNNGRDLLIYARTCLDNLPQVTEVTLAEFNEMTHSYGLTERDVPASAFDFGLTLGGPIVVGSSGVETLLMAYEHGSNTPNTYVHFRLSRVQPAGGVFESKSGETLLLPSHGCGHQMLSIQAAKGNYFHGQMLDAQQPYTSLWLQLGVVCGDLEAMAQAYRRFLLEFFSLSPASRSPYIFYNTWNFQERNRHWHGRPYLESMNEERILAEIEVAHQVGIDVFVLDTGWYAKTGEWQVDLQRFPRGLAPIRQKLDDYGMKLGLWFNPTAAAISSRLHQQFRDCVGTHAGREGDPFPVWETEESRWFCLVSRYANAFSEELIRLNRELGVTYFKWDAVGQEGGCDSQRHFHGGPENSAQERAECWEFELVRALVQIAEKVNQACPEAIIDLDLTESGRCLGLAFLASGKYFLINNGPYYHNYDLPTPTTNENIFFYPGAARATLCRNALSYDRWIPSILFLTHFFPDDASTAPPHWSRPQGESNSQEVNLASLILGGNGIWGDLLSLSPEGISHFAEVLGQYKQVRQAITHAHPLRSGAIGGSPEIHEKLFQGAGVVVIFSPRRGSYTYITRQIAGQPTWGSQGTEVCHDTDQHAAIQATFEQPGAKIVFFQGV